MRFFYVWRNITYLPTFLSFVVAIRPMQHISGPVNGNPYAQIDPSLKERLRSRPIPQSQENTTLNCGIDDLDSLLGDLGYSKSKKSCVDANLGINHFESNVTSSLSKQEKFGNKCEIKTAPVISETRATVERRSTLHQPPKLQNLSQAFTTDEVFTNNIASRNVNELLFELDNSPLNSWSNANTKQKAWKSNLSSYDNDSISGTESISGSEFDTVEDGKNSEEGIMVIQPGIVARYVESLSKTLFKEEQNEYNRKMGVPLPGLASPKLVEEKVTAFNSRSVARGYCSPVIDQVYHSMGRGAKINYQISKKEVTDGVKYSSKQSISFCSI